MKFVKKPVVIEAIRWTGENLAEVLEFTGKHPLWDTWFSSFEEYEAHVRADGGIFKIKTLEGTHNATPGDWIIRGVKGEHYPCKPDIFAATYDPDANLAAKGFDFGIALAHLKRGRCVAREGWNGKGMWIAMTPGSSFHKDFAKAGHAAAHRAAEVGEGNMIALLPHIDMRAADGSMVVGWLASQTDMLADDWNIVEPSGA